MMLTDFDRPMTGIKAFTPEQVRHFCLQLDRQLAATKSRPFPTSVKVVIRADAASSKTNPLTRDESNRRLIEPRPITRLSDPPIDHACT